MELQHESDLIKKGYSCAGTAKSFNFKTLSDNIYIWRHKSKNYIMSKYIGNSEHEIIGHLTNYNRGGGYYL